MKESRKQKRQRQQHQARVAWNKQYAKALTSPFEAKKFLVKHWDHNTMFANEDGSLQFIMHTPTLTLDEIKEQRKPIDNTGYSYRRVCECGKVLDERPVEPDKVDNYWGYLDDDPDENWTLKDKVFIRTDMCRSCYDAEMSELER